MTPTPHPHAELLIAIAEGKQMQFERVSGTFIDVSGLDVLFWLHCKPSKVRIKPSIITINGHEFPEPLRAPPEDGTEYWIVSLTNAPAPGWPMCWRGDEADWRWLKTGLCQATKQGAIDCTKALLSLVKAQS